MIPAKRNLCLRLSWDGEGFLGYQHQPHGLTVQGAIQEAWRIFTGETPQLFGCSRLDAGVSAYNYILNFHTACEHSEERILKAINGIFKMHFPQVTLRLLSCHEVPSDFHARFAALGKHYRYLLWYGQGEHAFWTPRSWHYRNAVTPQALPEIFKEFEGEHDFCAFRSYDCTAKTTVRKIFKISVSNHPSFPELYIIDIWGGGFLKNMIRNMVGTAVEMSVGRLPLTTIQEGFHHRDRTKIGQCAPAHGLTLMSVFYKQSEIKNIETKGILV